MLLLMTGDFIQMWNKVKIKFYVTISIYCVLGYDTVGKLLMDKISRQEYLLFKQIKYSNQAT